MAHVAEASESNGRVVFLMDPSAADATQACAAATRFASAFNAEIEAVAFNPDVVVRARSLPVATVTRGHVFDTIEVLERAEIHHEILTDRQLRAIGDAARRCGVSWFHTKVSGNPIDQLDTLCLSRGPWNVVILCEPVSLQTAQTANTIFANVSGATGIVVVPARCLYPVGPIAIVVEDGERLPAMLRAAGRLKGLCGRVHLLLAADTRKELAELEAHVRLMTTNHKGLTIEAPLPLLGVGGALDEKLRSLQTSFVVARLGGVLLPSPPVMARTIGLSGSPFLLVR